MSVNEREIRWAWDCVAPTERSARYGSQPEPGGSILIETRAETNAPAGTTLFVASTDSEDRAMDVVKQNWKLASFRSNPVILDNHDSRRVVGRAVEATVPKNGDDAGKLMIRVEWDQDSPDPTIRNVGSQHLRGIRKAGSVGFRAAKKTERHKLDKDSPYFREPIKVESFWGEFEHSGFLYESPELLEFSSATIPMNAEALQRSYFQRAEGEPPADAPEPDAPTDDTWAWLEDEDAVGKVADALFPVLMARAKSHMFPEPEEEDAPADEPVAEMAFRRLWVPRLRAFVRTDTDLRRILRAVLDTGPPPANLRGDGLDFLFPRS